ncbi:kelch motif-containing protein [Naegleria gruberi]|uniref:Kelch motif-containing protein n=1 Tax=Naegleria gruberi TaxID=5762 RepID=D2VK46_NAEGR|nr:kelch motif-containing protein [Naegleria gruberi]EFC42799.1 kelch motif-containing protein [Naegleria gruberi]|eukprot:XP_002675543.1 kelch motif-containing protein [Naegleria gruberi strain NEG-M]
MFRRLLSMIGVTPKQDTTRTNLQILADQEANSPEDQEASKRKREYELIEDCPPNSIVFLFGTESNSVYNRLVKYIVKQDKSKKENSDNLLFNSDSVVQYAPLPCSSHSIILLPKIDDEKNQLQASKRIIIWGGKKNVRDITSNMSTALTVKEDSLLTYYDCDLNMWRYAESVRHTYSNNPYRPNPSLFYHTTTLNPNNMCIYIFGGSSNDSSSADTLVSNKLYCVSIAEDWKWRFIPLESLYFQTAPPDYVKPEDEEPVTKIVGVRGHSCVYRSRKNSLIVYGGNFGGSKLSSNMFEFDCNTETWSLIPQVNKVAPRAYHNAIYCKNRDCMIVFGGEVFDNTTGRLEIIKDMCLFYFEEKRWYNILFRGDVPSPICTFGHCTTIVYDRFIISYGGCNREFQPKNQCLVFDLFERRWIKLNVKLKAVEVSAKHTLENSQNEEYWDLSYSTILPPLNCSAMTYDEEAECLVFYGGYVTDKEKCASLFRVKLDFSLFFVEKHFVYWNYIRSTLSNPDRFNDLVIKVSN